MATFAALPVTTCKDNLTVGQLTEHEYFGEDFTEGKNSVLIAVSGKGKYHAIWTYGSWDNFMGEIRLQQGDVTLQHTQTGRKIYLTFVTWFEFGSEDFVESFVALRNAKMKQWTLK